MGGIFRVSNLVIASLAVLLTAGFAHAQDDSDSDEKAAKSAEEDPPFFKVIKIKKNTAVVVFSKKHSPLKVGQKGRLVTKLVQASDGDVEAPSRTHFIGLDSSLHMFTTKVDGASAESKSDYFDINAIYGWNKEKFEYGVLLSYSFDKGKTTDSTSLEAGGLFDFNFGRNNVENDFVFGARGIFAIGQADNSGQTKAANTMRFEGGVIAKWFGLSPNLGATGFFGYRMVSTSADNVKSTTSGILGRIGIQAYF